MPDEATSTVPAGAAAPAPAAPAATAAPAAPAAPAPASNAPAWAEIRPHIPAEYAQEKMWESIPDTQTLLKNYAEGQRYIGGAIKIPGKDARPEEVTKFNQRLDQVEGVVRIPHKDAGQEAHDRFYAKLGRPETAAGYKPALPALPEGIPWEPALLTAYSKHAHAAGLNPTQLQKLLNGHAEMVWGFAKSQQKQMVETKAALEAEIGAGWESDMAYADAAVYQLGGEETFGLIRQSLKTLPAKQAVPMIKMMIRAGKLLAEDQKIDIRSITEDSKSTQAKVDAIIKDPKHAYWNDSAPDHKAAVAEVGRLYALLNPGRPGEQD